VTAHARWIALAVWAVPYLVLTTVIVERVGPWGTWLYGFAVLPAVYIVWRWPSGRRLRAAGTEVSYGVDPADLHRLDGQGLLMAATVHLGSERWAGLLVLGQSALRLRSHGGEADLVMSRDAVALGPSRPTLWREEIRLSRGGMVALPLLQPRSGVLFLYPAAASAVWRWTPQGAARLRVGQPAGFTVCPACGKEVDRRFARCPSCRAVLGRS
jgi:hypothetical protein